MSQEPNKKKIGLFLLLGIIVFFLIIGQSVLSRFKVDNKQIAVMYFNELFSLLLIAYSLQIF